MPITIISESPLQCHGIHSRWSQSQGIGIDDLSEDYLAAFVKRRPLRPASAVEMRTLRQFLRHLRIERGLPVSARGKSASPVDDLTEHYIHYLRTECGLAKNSILVYAPCVSRLSYLSIG